MAGKELKRFSKEIGRNEPGVLKDFRQQNTWTCNYNFRSALVKYLRAREECSPLTVFSLLHAPCVLSPLLLNINFRPECVWESFLHQSHWFPWERSVGSGVDGVAVCPGAGVHPESRLKTDGGVGVCITPLVCPSPSDRSHYRHYSCSWLK